MSIKKFSLPEFTAVVKDLFKHEKYLRIEKADMLDENTSFREALGITSLEIAELMIALEEKYNVNMEWVQTGLIDSINDVYNAFNESIVKQRKAFINKQILQSKSLIK